MTISQRRRPRAADDRKKIEAVPRTSRLALLTGRLSDTALLDPSDIRGRRNNPDTTRLIDASTTLVGGDEPRPRPVRQPAPCEPDIAERLKNLSSEQLAQVVSVFTDRAEGGDETAMRKALVRYVKECGDDAVEDRDEGTDEATARAAGIKEAIGDLEVEMFHAIAPVTPRTKWREVMGVTEQRLRELAAYAADAAALNKE